MKNLTVIARKLLDSMNKLTLLWICGGTDRDNPAAPWNQRQTTWIAPPQPHSFTEGDMKYLVLFRYKTNASDRACSRSAAKSIEASSPQAAIDAVKAVMPTKYIEPCEFRALV